jgi:hypothetical protein
MSTESCLPRFDHPVNPKTIRHGQTEIPRRASANVNPLKVGASGVELTRKVMLVNQSCCELV